MLKTFDKEHLLIFYVCVRKALQLPFLLFFLLLFFLLVGVSETNEIFSQCFIICYPEREQPRAHLFH